MSDLFEYGVHTSEADYWIHVCPGAGIFYYLRSIASERGEKGLLGARRQAKSANGKVTGEGYLVPIAGTPWIAEWELPARIWPTSFDWTKATDRAAGMAAEGLIKYCLSLHEFPVGRRVEWVIGLREQFGGKDAIVSPPVQLKIEVKCDRPAERTGNLFIQTAEKHHQTSGARLAGAA